MERPLNHTVQEGLLQQKQALNNAILHEAENIVNKKVAGSSPRVAAELQVRMGLETLKNWLF